MWNDPIVEVVRKVRDAHAKKFNYNLKEIAADLQRQQKKSQRKFVTLPARKPSMLLKANLKKG